MTAWKTPRFWLFIWGGLGALTLGYVLIAASTPPRERAAGAAAERAGGRADCLRAARRADLLVGDMAKFVFAVPPRAAPAEAFRDGERMRSLQDFAGRTVLVNFWATWCAPCLRELPSLDRLEALLADAPFDVLAIAADPSGPAAAREFFDRLGIKSLGLYTDETLRLASAVGGVSALPVSVLYGPDGREVGRLVGEADWTSPSAVNLVRSVAECG